MGEVNGDGELINYLGRLQRHSAQGMQRALYSIGALACREAVHNAPRSPTMMQLSATLKVKKRTVRRLMPGGLEKSIRFESSATRVSVFVPANSPAARYAKYIHDEKGKRWFKRGPGTIAKGSRADEKFILRAIRENYRKFTAIVKAELEKRI